MSQADRARGGAAPGLGGVKRLARMVLEPFGVLPPLRRARLRLVRGRLWLDEHLPDLLHRMDTCTTAEVGELGLDPAAAHAYHPAPWTVLEDLLPRSEVSRRDVFVDFGCGKGRVLYLAARYPFAKVVGVEISAALCAIARRNLSRNLRRLACRNVQIVSADVREFELPDDLTLAFFFNPFPRAVFEDVLERILASARREPRTMRLVYNRPEHGEDALLVSRGFAEVRRSANARLFALRPEAVQG